MMFYFLFEGTPRRESGANEDIGGAFINCWIERPTLEEAEHVARSDIEAEGWIVGNPEEAHAVDRSTYANNPVGMEYFEQALTDKEVFVFNQYPVVDEEE